MEVVGTQASSLEEPKKHPRTRSQQANLANNCPPGWGVGCHFLSLAEPKSIPPFRSGQVAKRFKGDTKSLSDMPLTVPLRA